MLQIRRLSLSLRLEPENWRSTSSILFPFRRGIGGETSVGHVRMKKNTEIEEKEIDDS